MMHQDWIDKESDVAVSRQCVLAGIARATLYARQKPRLLDVQDEQLKGLIGEEYTRHPFYGSRRMVVYLGRCGHSVNRKRLQRLMRTMGLACMAPHKVYPYLLRGVAIERSNQVWSTAIPHPADTRIRLPGGYSID
jgi:putative transposase